MSKSHSESSWHCVTGWIRAGAGAIIVKAGGAEGGYVTIPILEPNGFDNTTQQQVIYLDEQGEVVNVSNPKL